MPMNNALHMEAAMCLWEAFLEHQEQEPQLKAYRSAVGTVQTRHDLMEVVPACIAEWDAMTDDQRDPFIPYDWAWVPHFLLNRVDWTQPGSLKLRPR